MFHNDGEGGNDRSAEKRARNQIGVYVRVFGNVSVHVAVGVGHNNSNRKIKRCPHGTDEDVDT